MKKIKSIKKLKLRQEVIRDLTAAELKIVIGGMAEGDPQSKAEGGPTGC